MNSRNLNQDDTNVVHGSNSDRKLKKDNVTHTEPEVQRQQEGVDYSIDQHSTQILRETIEEREKRDYIEKPKTEVPVEKEQALTDMKLEVNLYGVSKPTRRRITGKIFHDED